MRNELDYWDRFWKGKRHPLHGSATPQHYDGYADELKVLFRKNGYNRILELGCGTGIFYQRLGFNKADYYKGIDLSESMLDEFRAFSPDVVLQRASAHDYLDDNKYDLIFSNGVMQHFNREMLRNHFFNAAKMLSEDGEIIDASIPWKTHRMAYRIRKLTPPYNSLNKATIKSVIALVLEMLRIIKDSMGHWYAPYQVAKIAREFGLRVGFYGSMYYPYRFHAVLRRM